MLNINSTQQKNKDADVMNFGVNANLDKVVMCWLDKTAGLDMSRRSITPKTKVPINKITKIGELIAKLLL
jgi:hypothetical protein